MSLKNKYHLELLSEIKHLSQASEPDYEGFGLKYMGTNKPSYHLDTTTTRSIAKTFVKSHHLEISELILLLNSLYLGVSFDEINIAAKIIEYSPKTRQQIAPASLDLWLGHVHGWAETDVLCQVAFGASDLLCNWSDWSKFLRKLSLDKNVHKRRSSLVLLTKPVRQSSDHRFSQLAFENIDLLKSEKDILITKAVSWLLRSLIKNHKDAVAKYLNENKELLPKIAVREVTNKLQTGKKYINKKINDHRKENLARFI